MTTMYDLKNPNFIVPTPLKEVIGSISACLYQSEFCHYSGADVATSMVTAAIQNKSLNAVSEHPNSDTDFWRIYNGITVDNLKPLIKTQTPPKGTHMKVLLDGHNNGFWGKDALGIVRTKPKNGTNKAFGYLAAFSNTNPKGIIAVEELFDGSVTNESEEMVKELRKDYTIDLLLADGEFYKAEFVDDLCRNHIPFIIRRTNTGNIRELGVKSTEPYPYKTDVKRPDGTIIHLKYWIYRYKGSDGDFFLISSSETLR